ncbi:hypothetical protein GCM10009554_31700 [Kribbella koreensis]|uniref:RNA polymerase sigma-70 factor (ECF subfamily) n=2 Tax=Kribbella TaxID=182639 RepID=A0ABP6YCY6_9ACTN
MKAIRYDSPEADIGTHGGGSELEFGELFDAYAAPLHRYLARRVGPDHAHDLVSETFLAAFKQRETYNPETAAVRSWLYGIATNLARRHVRQEVRGLKATARADNTAYQPSHDGQVADRVDAQAMARQIAPAIAELSDGDRDVLLLTSWSELTTVEVAEALDIPVGTVRSRLHRIRRLLRTHAATAHLTATPEAIHHD